MLTTQITHTIRCDTSWCSSPALASTPETELRATALGVPAAKMHAADAVALSWMPGGDIRGEDPHDMTWTCPSCRLVAPTAIDPRDRPRSDLPDQKQHSYRCACFRGPSAPWGPDEDCTCGFVAAGKAIVLGSQIVLDTGARWRHALVTAPATQFDGIEFEYTLSDAPSEIAHRARVANIGTRWKFSTPDVEPSPEPPREGVQPYKDRLTAVLALSQASTWPTIIAAVEHLVLPDRVSARQKAEALQVWRCACLYYHVHLQTSDVEDFETWWRSRP